MSEDPMLPTDPLEVSPGYVERNEEANALTLAAGNEAPPPEAPPSDPDTPSQFAPGDDQGSKEQPKPGLLERIFRAPSQPPAPPDAPEELVLGRDVLPTDADSAREAEFAALRAAGYMDPLPGDELNTKAAPEPEGIDLDEEATPAPSVRPPPELEFAMAVTDIRELRFVDKAGNGYYLDETRAGEFQLRLFWRNPNPPPG